MCLRWVLQGPNRRAAEGQVEEPGQIQACVQGRGKCGSRKERIPPGPVRAWLRMRCYVHASCHMQTCKLADMH